MGKKNKNKKKNKKNKKKKKKIVEPLNIARDLICGVV